jgi:oxygen-independent coproporphyrinogen-3 oxidase
MGGGTPSLWKEEGRNYLAKNIFNQVKINKETEFTIEIDPLTWTQQEHQAWKDLGANRFSIGLQSLDPYFLEVSDRAHSIEDSHRCLDLMKGENFSVDFLLGLPNSEEKNRDIIKELETALEYNPTHVSLYILTVPKSYIHFQSLPDDEWINKEYLAVSEFLRSKGFDHYEVSNFAKNENYSRNNYVYWEGNSFAGTGPSATGYLVKSPDAALRYKWNTSKVNYQIEQLTNKEMELEKLYLGLRTNIGLELENYPKKAQDKLIEWISRGLARKDEGRIKLNPQGFVIADLLIDELFSLKVI